MSPWCEWTLKLYKIDAIHIIYLNSKIAMKRRKFMKLLLSLMRQGLEIARVSCVELSAEEARRRGYRKKACYIVEPETTERV